VGCAGRIRRTTGMGESAAGMAALFFGKFKVGRSESAALILLNFERLN
jgi:hypothetical protein